MFAHITRRRVIFACLMSIITGSMTTTAAILYRFGLTSEFMKIWLETVIVVYPTITFSMLFVAPHVHRKLDEVMDRMDAAEIEKGRRSTPLYITPEE